MVSIAPGHQKEFSILGDLEHITNVRGPRGMPLKIDALRLNLRACHSECVFNEESSLSSS